MATAKKNTIQKEVTIGVTLDLTMEEAEALHAILGKMRADDPLYSMYDALDDAGITNGEFSADMATDHPRGVRGVKKAGE